MEWPFVLNSHFLPAWKSPKPIKVFYGGRASGKTWNVVQTQIFETFYLPGDVVIGRQFKNSAEESIFTAFKNTIAGTSIDRYFKINEHKIIFNQNGSKIYCKGIDRHTESWKGLEKIRVVIIEEAEKLTAEQWSVIEPIARQDGSIIVLIFNPDKVTDFVYSNFVIGRPENAFVLKANYHHNIFLPDKMRRTIETAKRVDPELYRHVYLGEPNVSDSVSVIKKDWVDACVGAHEVLDFSAAARFQKKCAGFDVADAGGDRCTWVLNDRGIIRECVSWKAKEGDLPLSARSAHDMCVESGTERMVYDSVGVGAGVGGFLVKTMKECRTHLYAQKFIAGSRSFKRPRSYVELYANVRNEDFFSNAKAQAWHDVGVRMRHTRNAVNGIEEADPAKIISLDERLKNLYDLGVELCVPERREDAAGKFKIESKIDLAKRGIRSTDLADALVMSVWGG